MANFTTQATIPEKYLGEARQVIDRYHPKPDEYTFAEWYGGKWIAQHLIALAKANRRDKAVIAASNTDTGIDNTFAG